MEFVGTAALAALSGISLPDFQLDRRGDYSSAFRLRLSRLGEIFLSLHGEKFELKDKATTGLFSPGIN